MFCSIRQFRSERRLRAVLRRLPAFTLLAAWTEAYLLCASIVRRGAAQVTG
jgi:hypothetical protein